MQHFSRKPKQTANGHDSWKSVALKQLCLILVQQVMLTKSQTTAIMGPSNKSVKFAFMQTAQTYGQAQLPMMQLSDEACKTDILPALKANSLLSVKVLADNGYTSIFHPHDKGATVHDSATINIYYRDEVLLQGWVVANTTSQQGRYQ